MATIIVSSGIFTRAEQTIEILSQGLTLNVVTDKTIIEAAAEKHRLHPATLYKVIEGKKSPFNFITNEKKKCMAALRLTLSDFVERGNCIFDGFIGHLIPGWVTHIMRVLIISDKKSRFNFGTKVYGLSEQNTLMKVIDSDTRALLWTNSLFKKNAWDESLYDIVIPADKMDEKEAADLISMNLGKIPGLSQGTARKEAVDFKLAAAVFMALSGLNSVIDVSSDNGNIRIIVKDKGMFQGLIQRKINRLAMRIPGVKNIEFIIGEKPDLSEHVRKIDVEPQASALLVDDEKEFVQTLSERLRMRQVQSDVVFSGKDALDYADRENTEVMVLDLKMPGIDGFEVLKRVKESKPDIEVIILTGHGSEEDKKICLEMGAFAYLQKPTDIEILTETMKKAYEKIRITKEKSNS